MCPPMPVRWLLHCCGNMCAQVDSKETNGCDWPITGIARVNANQSRAVQTLCNAWRAASIVHNWHRSKCSLSKMC